LLVASGNLEECRAHMRGSQTLEQGLISRRQPVVGFVRRSPQGVATPALGELADLQSRIV
jgi:hypothetical protein